MQKRKMWAALKKWVRTRINEDKEKWKKEKNRLKEVRREKRKRRKERNGRN